MNRTTTAALAALCATLALSACNRDNPDVRQAEKAAERMENKTEQKMDSAGATMDDATVTAKVKAALIANDQVKGLSINVDTSANVVTLRGDVPSDAMKTQAEQVARTVEGVKEVRNELVVKQAG